MPHCRVQIHRIATVGPLLLSALAMQDCMAIAWLGAIGIDRTISSDIEFQPFENSWVVVPQE